MERKTCKNCQLRFTNRCSQRRRSSQAWRMRLVVRGKGVAKATLSEGTFSFEATTWPSRRFAPPITRGDHGQRLSLSITRRAYPGILVPSSCTPIKQMFPSLLNKGRGPQQGGASGSRVCQKVSPSEKERCVCSSITYSMLIVQTDLGPVSANNLDTTPGELGAFWSAFLLSSRLLRQVGARQVSSEAMRKTDK